MSNVIEQTGHIEHTTRRVFGWGWGAALAAGGLTLVLGGSLAAAGRVMAMGAAAPVAYGLVGAVMDDIKARKWGDYIRDLLRRRDYLTTDHIETQNRLNAVRVIPRDQNANLGVAMNVDGQFHNMDTGEVFTLMRVQYLDPMRQQIDAIQRTLIALRGVNTGNAKQADALLESVPPPVMWPEKVSLEKLLRDYHIQPGYHRLVWGLTYNVEAQHWEPVVGDMEEMVHLLISGMTGFGKSTLLEAIAKQLSMGRDCDLAFVDYGVNTFGMLAEQAMFPIADSPEMTVALLRALLEEMGRRKARMQEYPQAKKLDQYNQASGDDLRPIVCIVDEASALFDRGNEIKDLASDLSRMGRKYGMGMVFGGTDFKADTMPSEARASCGARAAFHLGEPQLSRSIIRSAEAVNLRAKGRALVTLPGQAGLFEVQCPIVENWAEMPTARERVALEPVRASMEQAGLSSEQIDAIMDLHYQGESVTAISKAVLTYANRRTLDLVRGVIAEYDSDGAMTDNDEIA